MGLSLVTGPSTEPLTLTEAKSHLRVDHTTDDTLITALIVAARQAAETFTRRALITQTWELKLDGLPKVIEIPLPPLVSVTSLAYLDSNGVSQTIAVTTGYVLYAPAGPYAEPARITLPYGVLWPQVQAVENSVTLRYVAGYGAASAVPEAIKSAMRLIIGHLYENRENVVITERGSIVQQMPQGAEYLLWPYRDLRYA